MNRKRLAMVACLSFAMILALIRMKQVQAHAPERAYPSMAPLDEYLIADRNAEIALARSAAPASVADGATVMVMGRQGYTIAVPGTNGFLCYVERSWARSTDDPEFWNP